MFSFSNSTKLQTQMQWPFTDKNTYHIMVRFPFVFLSIRMLDLVFKNSNYLSHKKIGMSEEDKPTSPDFPQVTMPKSNHSQLQHSL